MHSRIRFFIGCFILLLVAVVLIWHTGERLQRHEAYLADLERRVAVGSAERIASRVKHQQQQVHAFAVEYAPVIAALAQNPEEDANLSLISERVALRFPDHFAFSIADHQGTPLVEDFDGLIGDICRIDLARYSDSVRAEGSKLSYPTYIHPQPHAYHFDVVAAWENRSGDRQRQSSGLFLISFSADQIATDLASSQIPGHQILLVKSSDRSLIEITSDGARDQIGRMRLTDAELERAHLHLPIEGTFWHLVVLRDPQLVNGFRDEMWRESLLLLGLIGVGLSVMIAFTARRAPRPRLSTG